MASRMPSVRKSSSESSQAPEVSAGGFAGEQAASTSAAASSMIGRFISGGLFVAQGVDSGLDVRPLVGLLQVDHVEEEIAVAGVDAGAHRGGDGAVFLFLMAVETSRPFPTCSGMSRVVAIPSPPYCKTGPVIVPVLFSFSVYHCEPPAARHFYSGCHGQKVSPVPAHTPVLPA